jgi:hypothetical protein
MTGSEHGGLMIKAQTILATLTSLSLMVQARADEEVKRAFLEFSAPAGAKIAVDGKEIDKAGFSVDDLKANELRRLKVEVKFADGGDEEHLVDVQPGQRIPVALPKPGKDKPIAVATQPLTPIMSSALSGDGRLIAAGLDNGAVVLWDVKAGRPIRSFFGHRAAVQSVALSFDARQLVTGSTDTTAILWDTHSGKQTHVFKGHSATIMSVAFSPDAKRVVTGSHDKTAIVWDADSGEAIHTLKGHKKEVFAVAFSPDGKTIATASFDTAAILWEAETGKEKLVLRGHKEEVSCLAFSPDGGLLATGSYENKSIVWETATGKRIGVSGRHENDIYSVTFTADGKRFITGDREGVIMMWDVVSGKKLRDFAGHIWEVSSVKVSDDGRTMVSGSRDGMVKLWDMATGLEIASLATDASRKGWAVTSPNGLFDGTDAGRRMVGYRFTKLPGAVIDQFFNLYYRSGLLAEISGGKRPFPPKAVGDHLPPRLKIVSPTARTAATQDVAVSVDIADQGGGVSGLAIYNNGARLAVPAKAEPAADPTTKRVTFPISLTQGLNRIRVKAACADGSWESAAELELTYPRTLEQKSRMYVVAIAAGDSARDVQALAELLRQRGAKHYQRVDTLLLLNQDAKDVVIDDALRDVGELSKPQDAVVVIHGGGAAPARLVELLGSARALNRALIADTDHATFGDRRALEEMSRLHGIYAIARNSKLASNSLIPSLVATANTRPESGDTWDIIDWFQLAADRSAAHVSSQARSFPILVVGKKR